MLEPKLCAFHSTTKTWVLADGWLASLKNLSSISGKSANQQQRLVTTPNFRFVGKLKKTKLKWVMDCVTDSSRETLNTLHSTTPSTGSPAMVNEVQNHMWGSELINGGILLCREVPARIWFALTHSFLHWCIHAHNKCINSSGDTHCCSLQVSSPLTVCPPVSSTILSFNLSSWGKPTDAETKPKPKTKTHGEFDRLACFKACFYPSPDGCHVSKLS